MDSPKPKLLLHVCCSPCATYSSYEKLAPRYDLTWYFDNSNLASRQEYDKRLSYVQLMAEKFGWPLLVEPYRHESWQTLVCSREHDPERGARCQICYKSRLLSTAKRAASSGFDYFSTSLLVSPYKDTEKIHSLGRELAEAFNSAFLDFDFQADDGYRRSQEMAKALGLYRQKFCGCEYSLQ